MTMHKFRHSMTPCIPIGLKDQRREPVDRSPLQAVLQRSALTPRLREVVHANFGQLEKSELVRTV